MPLLGVEEVLGYPVSNSVHYMITFFFFLSVSQVFDLASVPRRERAWQPQYAHTFKKAHEVSHAELRDMQALESVMERNAHTDGLEPIQMDDFDGALHV